MGHNGVLDGMINAYKILPKNLKGRNHLRPK